MIRMILGVNIDYSPKQHLPIDVYNGTMWCFLWDTDWILKYYFYDLRFQNSILLWIMYVASGGTLLAVLSERRKCCNPSIIPLKPPHPSTLLADRFKRTLGIPFFANFTALTESFNSKLAVAVNTLSQQFGRHLCLPWAVWNPHM
jgi:hypothetical protein